MRLLALIIVCLGPGGCGTAPTEDRVKIAAESVPFPADDLTSYWGGYKLEVPKTGYFLWNGQDISAEILQAYLKEDGGRGRLIVQFEPGTPDTRMRWVRKQVIAAGYCTLCLCVEAPWKAVRPVVY